MKLRATISFAVLLSVAVSTAQPQSPARLDPRLPVSTLVREDIFAGFMDNEMKRFARGEQSIELLLEQRPDDKAELQAWKAGATLYRAVLAHEQKRPDDFRKKYEEALALFAQAKKLGPRDNAVIAITAGTYLLFADRLPKAAQRAAAWSEAYDGYQTLWKAQANVVSKLPTHLRGELLGGLAQTAQRTGRSREADEYLNKILTLLPGTPYEPIARQWKKDPATAAASRIACLTCHAPGRLAARHAQLDKK